MRTTTESRPLVKRGVQALAVAAVLTLASCGGGGSDSTSGDGDSDGDKTTTTIAKKSGSSTPGSSTTKSAEAVAVLPIGGEAPDGYRLGDASCDADESESDGSKRATWIVYGVPEGWDAQGFSGGGSGGPHDSQELTFDTDGGNSDKGRVSVDVDWDSRKPDGTVLDNNGDPFESFDYDYSIGSDKHRVTYDQVATVQIGDGEADLFFLDPTQNTEMLGTDVEYKARVEAYEVPRSGSQLDQTTPYSFVVTIGFDGDDVDLSQADIEKILGSFTLPQCTWDKILADTELMLGVDLDGDGHARNAEDANAELREKLDAMRDQMPPEAQKRYDEMQKQLEDDD